LLLPHYLTWPRPIQLPPRWLDALHIDADFTQFGLRAGLLFGAAASLTVARGGAMQLLLPVPAQPTPAMAQVLQQVAAAADAQQGATPLVNACADALLDAFRANPGLAAAQLRAQQWTVSLVGGPGAVTLPPQTFLPYISAALQRNGARFGFLRAAGGAPEPFQFMGQVAHLVPLQLSRSAVDSSSMGVRLASWVGGACMAVARGLPVAAMIVLLDLVSGGTPRGSWGLDHIHSNILIGM